MKSAVICAASTDLMTNEMQLARPKLLPDPIERSVEALLRSVGKSDVLISCDRLGGGNNRSYRLETTDGNFLCKQYFRHHADTRDRLGAEFAFLRFCQTCGIEQVPKALAADVEVGVALYSWIEGIPLGAVSITTEHVQEAASFVAALAHASSNPAALSLAPAADASFCVQEYVDGVQKRLADLITACIDCGDAVSLDALTFLRQSLVPRWGQTREMLEKYVAENPRNQLLPVEERIVSPSDFGFHNTLSTSHGLCFVDFEYAGLDDPVKLICDFICQPALPAPEGAMDIMVQALLSAGASIHLRERSVRLLPLHRIKWCCIILNEFKRNDAMRRNFAKDISNTDARLLQLNKSKCYFSEHLA